MPDVMPTFAQAMGKGGSSSTVQQPSQSNQMPSFSQVMGKSSSSVKMPSINSAPNSAQNLSQMPTFAQAMGGIGAAKPPASTGWNGLLDNPITRAIGSGYTHTVGGMQGMVMQMIDPTSDQGFIKGFSNPTAENQSYQNLKSNVANTISPIIKNDMSLIPGLHPTSAVGNAITNFGMDSIADPLSYVPVGPVAKVVGKGLKLASDAAGATPYISKALTATAKAPGIKQTISGTKNALGTRFVKNYGASPQLVDALQKSEGAKAVDQHNILSSISDLSQGHGLTPEELNQTGHVVEKTIQGTPAQQAFAQKWSDLAYHGPSGAPVEVPQTLKDAVSPVAASTPAQAVSEAPKEPPSLDDLVKSNGYSQVTPETIAQTFNGKTWYHGSGSDKLTANNLDPFVGNHESLFGQGVYLTDNPKIAQGYADKRGLRTGTPTVNDLNVNVNKVLDIQKPITPDVASVIDKTVKPLDYTYERHMGEPNYFTDLMQNEMSKPGATPEGVIMTLRKEVRDFSHEASIPTSEFVEDFQNLATNLKNAGYDALTHTGGGRVGTTPHHVIIMLDPQNTYGATEGQGSQITRLGKYVPPDEVKQAEPTISAKPNSIPQTPSSAPGYIPNQLNGVSSIGTHAMLNTPSAVSGQPLLRSQLDNHFAHVYNNNGSADGISFPKTERGGSGLATDGTFNMERSFPTLADAQAKGLKPELDPYQVLGHQLERSSNALRNNEALAQIKSTPNLLFDKDPIDEIKKLTVTGRMDGPQAKEAMQALGLTEKDMQKGGIVQSKIPELSGHYIRKADEAALQDHLNPVQPKNFMRIANKAQETYNRGYLLNPTPHLHNVYVNGVVLGGAKPSYIKEAFNNIKNGVHDPMYIRALKSGAINNPVGGKFSDAISKTVEPTGGNIVSKTYNATKLAANGLQNSIGTIGSHLKAPLTPLYDASHNLLWNNDKAIRTALFRSAVEKGATDAQAAAHVNKFMVNYNDITPFERQYVKPLVPFYAWKKGNMPLQASQMVAQSPKYAIYKHATNAVSQALSGQPADARNRINSGQKLPDGSTTIIDPYTPMNDVTKAFQEGLPAYLGNNITPAIKEAWEQGTSLSGAMGGDAQNKYAIYNPAAPLGWNIRAGLAHAINNLNPLSGSAVAGSVGNQSNLVNKLLGMPTNNKPSTNTLEAVVKLLGGFTSRDNPATDAKNISYQNKDHKANLSKYRKALSKTK